MSGHEQDGIFSGMARWDDEKALTILFESLPTEIAANIREGRRQTTKAFSGMRHDESTARAFYVVADDTHIQVWTFKPTSFTEAATMWAALDQQQQAINLDIAKRVYTEVTGRELDHIH